MGSFNVKGVFSGLSIEYKEEVFIQVCVQYNKPLTLEEGDETGLNTSPSVVMYPITFPIFGEYADYGRVMNIKHDFNTDRLESVIGDTVENFLEVLGKIKDNRYLDQETIDKYRSYKKALLGETSESEESLKEKYKTYGIEKTMTLDRWIEFHRNMDRNNNQELTWTLDYGWVYNTMSRLYYSEIDKNFDYHEEKGTLFGSLSDVRCDFGVVWGLVKKNNPVYSYRIEICKFLGFIEYLSRNYMDISHTYSTGQEVDWERILEYQKEVSKFIEKRVIF